MGIDGGVHVEAMDAVVHRPVSHFPQYSRVDVVYIQEYVARLLDQGPPLFLVFLSRLGIIEFLDPFDDVVSFLSPGSFPPCCIRGYRTRNVPLKGLIRVRQSESGRLDGELKVPGGVGFEAGSALHDPEG